MNRHDRAQMLANELLFVGLAFAFAGFAMETIARGLGSFNLMVAGTLMIPVIVMGFVEMFAGMKGKEAK